MARDEILGREISVWNSVLRFILRTNATVFTLNDAGDLFSAECLKVAPWMLTDSYSRPPRIYSLANGPLFDFKMILSFEIGVGYSFAMKYLIFGTAFVSIQFIHIQAQADFFFIQNDKIYSVQSKYSPEKTSVDNAKFLKINLKTDKENGTIAYLTGGIAPLSAFALDKSPTVPKVVAGEGCGENPMTWLKSSKVVGRLKKKESAIYVQVPAEIASVGKASAKCPGEDRFANPTPQFAIGEKNFTTLVCEDDLNATLFVLNSKSIEADLVITDNCP